MSVIINFFQWIIHMFVDEFIVTIFLTLVFLLGIVFRAKVEKLLHINVELLKTLKKYIVVKFTSEAIGAIQVESERRTKIYKDIIKNKRRLLANKKCPELTAIQFLLQHPSRVSYAALISFASSQPEANRTTIIDCIHKNYHGNPWHDY